MLGFSSVTNTPDSKGSLAQRQIMVGMVGVGVGQSTLAQRWANQALRIGTSDYGRFDLTTVTMGKLHWENVGPMFDYDEVLMLFSR